MNDDYLWDKSGQPDPQVQQLEEILGTLRYQPKPFEVPQDVPLPRRRNYFPLLAIAATLLVALLAGSIWLRVRTSNHAQPQQARVPEVSPVREEKKIAVPEVAKNSVEKRVTVPTKHRIRSSTVLARREREEALAVKQQLMFALRLASEKINLAHRRTQSTSPVNQIRNQHRVG